MSDLTNRLRGHYSVGPQGEFGTRSFSHFIPPICTEAADRIDALEKEMKHVERLLNAHFERGGTIAGMGTTSKMKELLSL